MGLDFKIDTEKSGAPDEPRWGYGSFMDFRKTVAASIAIDLYEMSGFDGNKPWDADHPLTPFLSHSDCDGDLTPEECGKIYPVLREILAKWVGEEWHVDEGLMLCRCMEFCANNDAKLIFC